MLCCGKLLNSVITDCRGWPTCERETLRALFREFKPRLAVSDTPAYHSKLTSAGLELVQQSRAE